MKRHPRDIVTQQAGAELALAVGEIIKNHDLTYGELMQIFNEVQGRWIGYQIRDERHPNEPDKPSCVA